MILGYNTNGLANHELSDAIELLAEIGYRGVAVTIDHGAVNPYSHGYESQVDKLRRLGELHGLTYVIETGARFLLDPRRKHEPTLVSAAEVARARRVEFLKRAIDTAKLVGSQSVSLWSGVVHDGAPREVAFERLVAGLSPVLEHAQLKGVLIAFEPEPGMLVDTLDAYGELKQRVAASPAPLEPLRLTIDIGHLHCQGETPIAGKLHEFAGELVNLHIEDMRRGVHEHLMFGEGEIDFPPIIAALRGIGYAGPLNVELSRHSHDGPNAARRAYAFLSPLIDHAIES